MTKPVTIPNTFATATTAIPLSNLDADFSTVATAMNDANTYSNYAPDTGSANAYVVTLTGVSTTYSAGLRIQFKAGNANTTASTLNVNAQGAKNITYQDASAIASGTIAANSIVDVMYDGTQFLLMNDPAGGTGGDVVGPASATDNAIVRFDGTTGKLVQNSVVTIADSTGDISGVGQLNATTVDATNIEVTNIKAKDGTAAATIADSTGVVTVTAAPVMTALTASQAVFTTSGKALTSNAITGTGNVVMSASPTLTGTIAGASLQLSSLTSGRVTYATTSGLLTDSANLLYSGTDLTVYGVTVGRGAGAQGSNTVVGLDALVANTTGVYNTATGTQALRFNTTGQQNSAFGYQSLYTNTTGNFNSAGSMFALFANTTGSNNTAFGLSALEKNTTASNNTAVGYQAAYTNTTGTLLTAIGRFALYANTTGSYNIAVGDGALNSNTTASNNTALGYQAGYSNQTGTSLVAIGYRALYSNTAGSNMVAIGDAALYTATGDANIAIGTDTARAMTTGSNNVAVGQQALRFNTTASNNTAVGYQSLYANTTATGNTAVGAYALDAATTGGSNTAMGIYALTAVITGVSNSAFGEGALIANTASNNTAVGYQAGDVITTGARNTIIGDGSDPSANNGNDQTVVGQGLTGKGDDTAFIGGTNGAYNEKNVTTWETTSDERIKKNIVDNTVGLEKIKQIRIRNFEYRKPEEITELPDHAAINKDGVQLGVIAQEIQQVLPECVTENSTGVLSVSTDPLVWHLINAVKQLSAEVESLKSQLKGN